MLDITIRGSVETSDDLLTLLQRARADIARISANEPDESEWDYGELFTLPDSESRLELTIVGVEKRTLTPEQEITELMEQVSENRAFAPTALTRLLEIYREKK